MCTSSRLKPLPSLSIFFPAFNDANSIAALVRGVDQTAKLISNEHEIIVVDDGSRDVTLDVLTRLVSEIPVLKIIRHPANRGYGAALRSGFAAAGKAWVFYTDGDAQYDPAELVNLVAALNESTDVVNGFKTKRQDPRLRVWAGSIYGWLARKAFHLPIRDVDCDFRLIRRDKMSSFQLRCDSGAICVELVKKLQLAGCRFTEVAVTHYPRRYGRSRFFRLVPVLKTFRQLAGLYSELVLFPAREE